MIEPIMTALLLALLLATASGSSQVGRLYVHVVTPGLQILIDGVPAGTSTAEEGGKLIKNVTAGTHRVIVRAEDGREASFNANVSNDLQTDITVSPLGFRKLNRAPDTDETSTLRVTSIPTEAMVEFNNATRQNYDATELTFDNVPPGKYLLVVTSGGKAIRSEVDMPKASVVTVDINAKASTARVTDTHLRPRRMQISEPNDALRMLNVPGHWKGAIRNALPNTVSIVEASASGNSVRVRLKVPSDKMVEPLLRSLDRGSVFNSVSYGSYPRREPGGGWIVDFVFQFPS